MCGRVLRRGVTLHRECCDSLVLLLEGTVQDVDSVVVVCVLESVGAVHEYVLKRCGRWSPSLMDRGMVTGERIRCSGIDLDRWRSLSSRACVEIWGVAGTLLRDVGGSASRVVAMATPDMTSKSLNTFSAPVNHPGARPRRTKTSQT